VRRPTLLPDEQLETVVTAIYSDAQSSAWENLSVADRTRQYNAWVSDERVGGILTQYMTPEKARSWIKDGPMKEYGRARRGTGRYARFGRQAGTTAEDVVRAALGAGAVPIPGTEGLKPFHCRAQTTQGGVAFVAWGEARNFRNLLWAALRASVEDGVPSHVVVMEPPGGATPRDVVTAHTALAARCGLGVHHISETIGAPVVGGHS